MTKLNALAGVVHKSAILNQDGISVNVLHEDVFTSGGSKA